MWINKWINKLIKDPKCDNRYKQKLRILLQIAKMLLNAAVSSTVLLFLVANLIYPGVADIYVSKTNDLIYNDEKVKWSFIIPTTKP